MKIKKKIAGKIMKYIFAKYFFSSKNISNKLLVNWGWNPTL